MMSNNRKQSHLVVIKLKICTHNFITNLGFKKFGHYLFSSMRKDTKRLKSRVVSTHFELAKTTHFLE